ncbi:MAG TPA: cytochrome b N-terminal domain-containing protein [Streptosporangiaceae bacterium]|nr:cytochrome b N-terminal domain-containing protein [Streptosporangiaceae bacterium]
MNQPSDILHWSFIDITLANLIVIAVMVVIFGLALVLRFPHGRSAPLPADTDSSGQAEAAAAAAAEPGDADMWTAKVRTKAASLLPPKKLLPDRQPAYVASWIYTFGVASLVALGIVIASGLALALGGSDWWHTNPIGHFFNSVHLWSVELFMALLVIHLWGKFWMAAWRGRRAMTWITGVIAFLASILTAFTGYLSQQNFDSQWISVSGKDAFNSVGVGAFFNPMNFGQMFMWHIVLMPLVLVVIIGAHILLVRMRGVSHPLPQTRVKGREARKAAAAQDARPWRGPNRRYDIIKETVAATALVGTLTLILAGLLSSPNIPAVTVQAWAQHDQLGFVNTAAMQLDGTSETATYGPPYNHGTAEVQQLGPINWQTLSGITQRIDAAQTFVIAPLTSLAKTTPALATALATYKNASPAQQVQWAAAYDKATAGTTTKTPFNQGNLNLPAAGPVPVMMSYELAMARSGALDTDLLAQRGFYGTDFTKPLLFLEDGAYFGNLATQQNLQGDQWGVMNETGQYPGQPWLWLYQLWYHIPPGSTRWSAVVDVWAVVATGICTMALLFVPFIPGLRDIPRLIPVHRLIWRDWNRSQAGGDRADAGDDATHKVNV